MKLNELEAYLGALCRINKDGILMMMLRDRESSSLDLDQIRRWNDKKPVAGQPAQQNQSGSSHKVFTGDHPASDIPS